MIPISKVVVSEAEISAVVDVLRSGNIAQGKQVETLEKSFAKAYGIKHVVAVNNGTTALVAALRAQGVGPGDEVITSPFTFAATLNAILEVGATPVFVDINPEDFNINSDLVPPAITEKTRCLMPVHLYGQMANMTNLSSIASAHGLQIIQDAAQAQGASQAGVYAGASHTATFSLYATKNMTTGEGGLIATDEDDVAEEIRTLRNQGMKSRYEYVRAGFNWRMTDLQAALGVVQLTQYEHKIDKRAQNAAFYFDALSGIAGIVLPKVAENNSHVWHQFTLRITPDAKVTRDELAQLLAERNISTGIYYPRAVYDYDVYRQIPSLSSVSCPIAEQTAGEVLSIPVHPELSKDELFEITTAIREISEVGT